MEEPDWSHIEETIKFLSLAVAQLEVSILDSEVSVDSLSQSFTRIMQAVHSAEANPEKIHNELNAVKSDVQKVVTDFQFYDRLAQRLSHIKDSLNGLGDLFRTQNNLANPDAWHQLQTNLKSCYTMACEREMFDLIVSGSTIEEALEHYRSHHLLESGQSTENDIDLF